MDCIRIKLPDPKLKGLQSFLTPCNSRLLSLRSLGLYRWFFVADSTPLSLLIADLAPKLLLDLLSALLIIFLRFSVLICDSWYVPPFIWACLCISALLFGSLLWVCDCSSNCEFVTVTVTGPRLWGCDCACNYVFVTVTVTVTSLRLCLRVGFSKFFGLCLTSEITINMVWVFDNMSIREN